LICCTLSGILITRITPKAIPVELDRLSGLFSEIVYHHWLYSHLDYITGMGPIELST
jgi:hypothetical protein